MTHPNSNACMLQYLGACCVLLYCTIIVCRCSAKSRSRVSNVMSSAIIPRSCTQEKNTGYCLREQASTGPQYWQALMSIDNPSR